MANNQRDRLIDEYESALRELNYITAMKKVGAMYYICYDNAREKEAKLLFLMKEYSKIIEMLSNVNMTQLETEIYVASLAVTNQFNKVNSFLEDKALICIFCSAYIQRYMEIAGRELTNNFSVKPPIDDFFKKILIKDIALELVMIYEELEDAIILGASGVDISNIINRNAKKVKQICIKDHLLDQIYSDITEKGCFDPNYVIEFIYMYIGYVNIDTSLIQGFKELDDIIFYLDIRRRIAPQTAVLETMVEYLNVILKESAKKNPIVGDYLAELCICAESYEEFKLNDQNDISCIFESELKKNYPTIYTKVLEIKNDNTIKKKVSKKGKIAYDAATWQYYSTINSNYGIRDAGMLCLSYMRIIELELNDLVVDELKKNSNSLRNLFESEKILLTGKDKKNFIDKWKICIEGFEKVNYGFTLEKLWNLFVNLSDHRDRKDDGKASSTINNEDKISITIKKYLCSVLNNLGINAIKNGRFVDLISAQVRDKYRNPPAHTRYVNKETAIECKLYVEQTINEIYGYKK